MDARRRGPARGQRQAGVVFGESGEFDDRHGLFPCSVNTIQTARGGVSEILTRFPNRVGFWV